MRSGYWYRIPLLPFGKMRDGQRSQLGSANHTNMALVTQTLLPSPVHTGVVLLLLATTTGAFMSASQVMRWALLISGQQKKTGQGSSPRPT